MVYIRLFLLVLLASLCEVSQGACSRRGRAGSVPCVVPAAAATCLSATPCPGRRYERTLEDIISKLINALIYTTIRNGNGGSTGGSGPCGSGIGIGLNLAGQDLVDVELLSGLIGGSSVTSGSSSGGSDAASGRSDASGGGDSAGDSGTSTSCGCSGTCDCDTGSGSGGSDAATGGSGACNDGSISEVVKLLESLLNVKVKLMDDNNVIKICLLEENES